MLAASADSGPVAFGHTGDQLGDKIAFGRKVTVDRAGGDIGAVCHRRNLHGAHAVFAGDRLRCVKDRLLTLREAADDVFGATIGHAMTEC